MTTTTVIDLHLAVKSIPRVQATPSMTPPSLLAIKSSNVLEFIEDGGDRDYFPQMLASLLTEVKLHRFDKT